MSPVGIPFGQPECAAHLGGFGKSRGGCRTTGALRNCTGDLLRGCTGLLKKKSSVRETPLELISDPTEKNGARAWSFGRQVLNSYVQLTGRNAIRPYSSPRGRRNVSPSR